MRVKRDFPRAVRVIQHAWIPLSDGCLLGSAMLSWALALVELNARPLDTAVVGERWREQWLERLGRTPPFVEAWLAQQRRDAYWRHGSVCEDYAAIECPVYAVGGWA